MTETRPLNADEIFTDRDYLALQADQIERLAQEGKQPAVDPDLADYMGAFEEEGLYTSDALDSLSDVDEDGIVITGEDLPADQIEGEVQ